MEAWIGGDGRLEELSGRGRVEGSGGTRQGGRAGSAGGVEGKMGGRSYSAPTWP